MPSVPEYFTKELKHIDEDLSCKWDSKRHRYRIYCRVPRVYSFKLNDGTLIKQITRRDAPVFLVQNADGSYRPLDNRTLNSLRAYDPKHDRGRAENVIKDIEAQEAKEDADVNKKMQDLDYEVGNDLYSYALNGKKNFSYN